MSLKEKIYNELKTCPSLQAMIDTLQDATTPGGSLTPGWLTKKFGRGEPMTFEQADNGKTNPKYKEGIKNGYNINCATTVLTFEARLRGYNVEAMPNTDTPEKNCKIGTPDWLPYNMTKFFAKMNTEIKTSDECTTTRKTIKFLDEEITQGQRFFLAVGWRRRRRAGHGLLAYKDDLGNVVVYCPQTNKIYDDKKKLTELFERVKRPVVRTAYGDRRVLNFYIARIDNMPFDREMMSNLFTKAGETK